MTDDPAELELPRAIALAWGVAANPQRGPKRELSIERIVETALEIADAGGLGAVSMSSVASALGYTPMSLYRYVSAKDDLVLLLQEAGIGLPPESITEAATESGWRRGLEAWAGAQIDMYRAHPWILDIPITGTPTTPNNLAWLDVALAILSGSALQEEEKIAVALAVMAQVRWQSGIERGYLAAAGDGGVENLDVAAESMLRLLVADTEFPSVAAALSAGAFGPAPAVVPDPFRFGLDRVLDGVETYLESLPATARPTPSAGAAPDASPTGSGQVATRSTGAGRAAAPTEGAVADASPAVLADKNVREWRKRVREAEKSLREARKHEREALKNARARLTP